MHYKHLFLVLGTVTFQCVAEETATKNTEQPKVAEQTKIVEKVVVVQQPVYTPVYTYTPWYSSWDLLFWGSLARPFGPWHHHRHHHWHHRHW